MICYCLGCLFSKRRVTVSPFAFVTLFYVLLGFSGVIVAISFVCRISPVVYYNCNSLTSLLGLICISILIFIRVLLAIMGHIPLCPIITSLQLSFSVIFIWFCMVLCSLRKYINKWTTSSRIRWSAFKGLYLAHCYSQGALNSNIDDLLSAVKQDTERQGFELAQ